MKTISPSSIQSPLPIAFNNQCVHMFQYRDRINHSKCQPSRGEKTINFFCVYFFSFPHRRHRNFIKGLSSSILHDVADRKKSINIKSLRPSVVAVFDFSSSHSISIKNLLKPLKFNTFFDDGSEKSCEQLKEKS